MGDGPRKLVPRKWVQRCFSLRIRKVHTGHRLKNQEARQKRAEKTLALSHLSLAGCGGKKRKGFHEKRPPIVGVQGFLML